MGRIGFWQLLLDDKMSSWEAQRINEAQDAAELAQSQVDAAHQSIDELGRRVQAMGREIIMLRTALTVLSRTLKDTGVVDEALLDRRLEAAMEEAFPRPDPQAPHAAPRVVCLRCRQSVVASTTTMTADGPMCDRCPPPASAGGRG